MTFYILFNFGTQNAAIDPFNGAGVYVFLVLNQLYVWALVVQFVTSFGNRPQGTKWLYHAIVVLFAFIMVFLMYVSIRSVASTLLDVPNFIDNIGIYIIASPLLRNIVIALLGTYGMYMFASVLHLDPWHM